MKLPSDKFSHVIVLGAGLSGLMQAIALHSCGLSFLVLERRTGHRRSSRVGLLHAPTLYILQRLGLLDRVVKVGRAVDRADAFAGTRQVSHWAFTSTYPDVPPAIAIAQADIEEILARHLESIAPECIRRGVNIKEVQNTAGSVKVRALFGVSPAELSAAFLVATDGPASPARAKLDKNDEHRTPAAFFLSGDFLDDGAMGDAVRLVVDGRGMVESLPLPGRNRRWLVQTSGFIKQPEEVQFVATVKERTGVDLTSSRNGVLSSGRVEGWLAAELVKGRIILSGEAGYGLMPLGGGSLNQGWSDARDVAGAIQHIIQSKAVMEVELANYTSQCKARVLKALEQQSDYLDIGRSESAGFIKSLARAVNLRLPGRNPAEQLYSF